MIDVAIIHRGFNKSITDETEYTDLTQVGGINSLNTSNSLGKTVGTVDISLLALDAYSRDDGTTMFAENDSIDIYVSYDTINRDDLSNMYVGNNIPAFLMSTTIGSINWNITEGKETIEITGADKTSILTSINAERTSYSNTNPIPTYIFKPSNTEESAIHNLISEVNEKMRTAYGETNDSGGNKWQNIEVASDSDDCSDVSGYSRLNVGFPFKSYAEIFNEFSQGAYTDKVQFTFWIDARNQFHWKKLGIELDDTLTIGTDLINNIKFKEEVYDTVNAAVVNAGTDLHQIGIWSYVLNEVSAAEVGLRWEIMADLMLSKDYASLERSKTSGVATSVSGTVLTDSSQSWATNEFTGMYLINPAPPNTFPIVSNTATTITVRGEGLKESEYTVYGGTNENFREAVRDIGLDRAEAKLAITAKLRFRGDVAINGTLTHDLNEVFDLTVPYFGFTTASPKRMRLTDIAHNIASGSWKTSLTFKEDVGTEGSN